MRGVRKLEGEHIAPKRERPLEVGDCDAGVIGGNDAKWRPLSRSHARNRNRKQASNAQLPTLNSGERAPSRVGDDALVIANFRMLFGEGAEKCTRGACAPPITLSPRSPLVRLQSASVTR